MRSIKVRSLPVIVAVLLLLAGLSTMSVAGPSCCASKAKKSGDDKTAQTCRPGESNIDKASAVLKALESGDAVEIGNHVSDKNYVQHNLAFPDGRGALTTAIKSGMLDGTSVDIERIFEDGDFVVAHSEYTLFGTKQVGFDVFRFENGVIVEHWDNLQSVEGQNVSARRMLAGPTKPRVKSDTETSRKVVRNFVNNVLVGGNMSSAASYFDGDKYTQHSPGIGDGLSTLLEALRSGAIDMRYDENHFVHASGDFALAMSEGRLNGEHVAFYDLFRVDDGFIAEHWDVVQAIPPQGEWANANGKF